MATAIARPGGSSARYVVMSKYIDQARTMRLKVPLRLEPQCKIPAVFVTAANLSTGTGNAESNASS